VVGFSSACLRRLRRVSRASFCSTKNFSCIYFS
jgi:hypothetical protein